MMGAVRRMVLALVSGWALAAGLPASGGDAARAARCGRSSVPAQLDAPGGLAVRRGRGPLRGRHRSLPDPGRWRRAALMFDGLRLRPGRAAVLAGGSCSGRGSIGYPSGVAVDGRGDVFIALATAARVDEVRAGGDGAGRPWYRCSGRGRPGSTATGGPGTATELDHPAGIAVDAAGDLFVADTANCRVRVLPARSGTIFGQPVTAGRRGCTVAGHGRVRHGRAGWPAADGAAVEPGRRRHRRPRATCWSPTAATSRCCWRRRSGGTFYGTAVGAGDIGVVRRRDGELWAVSRRRGARHQRRGGAQRPSGGWRSARPVRSSSPTGSCTPSGSCPPRTGPLLGRSMTRGRPLHRGGRAAGEDGVGARERHALDAHPDGDAGRHRGLAVGRRDLQRRQPRHRAGGRAEDP